MLELAWLGGSFMEPDPINYLFGAGIATNIGAAFVCVLLGYAWSKTKFWPLHAIHAHLRALSASHEALHAKLDDHADMHAAHSDRLARIEALLKPDDDRPPGRER